MPTIKKFISWKDSLEEEIY